MKKYLTTEPFAWGGIIPSQSVSPLTLDIKNSLRKADSLQAAGVAFNATNFPHWIEDSRYRHVPPLSATQYGDTFTQSDSVAAALEIPSSMQSLGRAPVQGTLKMTAFLDYKFLDLIRVIIFGF